MGLFISLEKVLKTLPSFQRRPQSTHKQAESKKDSWMAACAAMTVAFPAIFLFGIIALHI
jgi:hypothetical protein